MTEVSNTKTDSVESVESVENNKSTGASNYKKAEKPNFHTRREALSGSFQLTSDDIQLPAAAQEVSTPRLPDYCGGEKFDYTTATLLYAVTQVFATQDRSRLVASHLSNYVRDSINIAQCYHAGDVLSVLDSCYIYLRLSDGKTFAFDELKEKLERGQILPESFKNYVRISLLQALRHNFRYDQIHHCHKQAEFFGLDLESCSTLTPKDFNLTTEQARICNGNFSRHDIVVDLLLAAAAIYAPNGALIDDPHEFREQHTSSQYQEAQSNPDNIKLCVLATIDRSNLSYTHPSLGRVLSNAELDNYDGFIKLPKLKALRALVFSRFSTILQRSYAKSEQECISFVQNFITSVQRLVRRNLNLEYSPLLIKDLDKDQLSHNQILAQTLLIESGVSGVLQTKNDSRTEPWILLVHQLIALLLIILDVVHEQQGETLKKQLQSAVDATRALLSAKKSTAKAASKEQSVTAGDPVLVDDSADEPAVTSDCAVDLKAVDNIKTTLDQAASLASLHPVGAMSQGIALAQSMVEMLASGNYQNNIDVGNVLQYTNDLQQSLAREPLLICLQKQDLEALQQMELVQPAISAKISALQQSLKTQTSKQQADCAKRLQQALAEERAQLLACHYEPFLKPLPSYASELACLRKRMQLLPQVKDRGHKASCTQSVLGSLEHLRKVIAKEIEANPQARFTLQSLDQAKALFPSLILFPHRKDAQQKQGGYALCCLEQSVAWSLDLQRSMQQSTDLRDKERYAAQLSHEIDSGLSLAEQLLSTAEPSLQGAFKHIVQLLRKSKELVQQELNGACNSTDTKTLAGNSSDSKASAPNAVPDNGVNAALSSAIACIWQINEIVEQGILAAVNQAYELVFYTSKDVKVAHWCESIGRNLYAAKLICAEGSGNSTPELVQVQRKQLVQILARAQRSLDLISRQWPHSALEEPLAKLSQVLGNARLLAQGQGSSLDTEAKAKQLLELRSVLDECYSLLLQICPHDFTEHSIGTLIRILVNVKTSLLDIKKGKSLTDLQSGTKLLCPVIADLQEQAQAITQRLCSACAPRSLQTKAAQIKQKLEAIVSLMQSSLDCSKVKVFKDSIDNLRELCSKTIEHAAFVAGALAKAKEQDQVLALQQIYAVAKAQVKIAQRTWELEPSSNPYNSQLSQEDMSFLQANTPKAVQNYCQKLQAVEEQISLQKELLEPLPAYYKQQLNLYTQYYALAHSVKSCWEQTIKEAESENDCARTILELHQQRVSTEQDCLAKDEPSFIISRVYTNIPTVELHINLYLIDNINKYYYNIINNSQCIIKKNERLLPLAKIMLDVAKNKVEQAFARFKLLYSGLCELDKQAVNLSSYDQGAELLHLFAQRAPILDPSEQKRLMHLEKDVLQKKIIGALKDNSKAKGEQRSRLDKTKARLISRGKTVAEQMWSQQQCCNSSKAVSFKAKTDLYPKETALPLSYTAAAREYKTRRFFYGASNDAGTHIKLDYISAGPNKGKLCGLKLWGRIFSSDHRLHPVSLPISFNPKIQGVFWNTLLQQRKGKLKIAFTQLNYGVKRIKKGQLQKQINVCCCIHGLSPVVSAEIKKVFEQHGIDLNSKEQMQQWRKRVVALDLGTGTIAVCASNGEEIELDFMDILLLSGDKETIKQAQQLKDNIAQAQYDYSKYQLSINPQLYNERGARLSIAELRAAKISTIERRDQMSEFLLNKLRRCHCDFEFFRHQQHFKLICALLPLGGSVRVEPMNYQGMAKRRQVKEGASSSTLISPKDRDTASTANLVSQTRPSASEITSNNHLGSVRSESQPDANVNPFFTRNASSTRTSINNFKWSNPNLPKTKSGYGRTIGSAAPRTFVSLYQWYIIKLGGSFEEVNSNRLKASQIDPFVPADDPKAYQKLGLSERYHMITDPIDKSGATKIPIQRDLWAAFIIAHACGKDLGEVDVEACKRDFTSFLMAYEKIMKQLEQQSSDRVRGNIALKKV